MYSYPRTTRSVIVSVVAGLTLPLQPRRLRIAPAVVGCKRVLAGAGRLPPVLRRKLRGPLHNQRTQILNAGGTRKYAAVAR